VFYPYVVVLLAVFCRTIYWFFIVLFSFIVVATVKKLISSLVKIYASQLSIIFSLYILIIVYLNACLFSSEHLQDIQNAKLWLENHSFLNVFWIDNHENDPFISTFLDEDSPILQRYWSNLTWHASSWQYLSFRYTKNYWLSWLILCILLSSCAFTGLSSEELSLDCHVFSHNYYCKSMFYRNL